MMLKNMIRASSIALALIFVSPIMILPRHGQQELSFQVQGSTQQHSKIKCLLLIIGSEPMLEKIAKIIQFDIEFSDQIEIDAKKTHAELNAKTLSKIYDRGTSLCLYLKELKSTCAQPTTAQSLTLQAIIKDPASNMVLFDKIFTCPNTESKPRELVYHAHKISDELLPALTGSTGPMLSTLAYCKQTGLRQKVVCLADYACKIEKTIIANQTINIAPSWHSHAPLLFYSQFTRSNSRLMSFNPQTRKSRIICSYGGLNMQPSFSPDGSRCVLCLSGSGNAELYLYDQAIFNKLKKRVFKPVTNNKANNVSPCYLPNGDVIFCSDFQTGLPQIYLLDHNSKATTRLTNGQGYCAAPSHCTKTNSIVYTRYVQGVFQLFSINLNDAKPHEKQLTFAHGDKNEPSWSSCGKYIAFSFGHRDPETSKLTSQIACLNTTSGKVRILTSGPEHKSFPAWTPRSFYQV